MIKMNKFYVGAEHIALAISENRNETWTHPTIEKAIQHAKDIMESEDREIVIVVQVVRVLRRSKTPIIVEKVK